MKTGGTILMTLGLIIFLLLALNPNSKNNNEKKNGQLFNQLYAITLKNLNTKKDSSAPNSIGKPGDLVKKKAKKEKELSSSELAAKLLGNTPGTTPAKKEPSELRGFYDRLKRDNIAPNLPAYDKFSSDLQKNPAARKSFYQGLQKSGKLNLPDYKTFSNTLFPNNASDSTPKDSKLTDRDLRQMGLLPAKNKKKALVIGSYLLFQRA